MVQNFEQTFTIFALICFCHLWRVINRGEERERERVQEEEEREQAHEGEGGTGNAPDSWISLAPLSITQSIDQSAQHSARNVPCGVKNCDSESIWNMHTRMSNGDASAIRMYSNSIIS